MTKILILNRFVERSKEKKNYSMFTEYIYRSVSRVWIMTKR